MPVPGSIFIATGKDLFVFAYKGKERPSGTTQLWQSPFFNVYGDGRLCIGSATIPMGEGALKSEGWESMFYNSYFTHPNMQTGLVKWKSGAYGLWKELLDGKLKVFPERALVQTKETLDAAFRRIVCSREDA